MGTKDGRHDMPDIGQNTHQVYWSKNIALVPYTQCVPWFELSVIYFFFKNVIMAHHVLSKFYLLSLDGRSEMEIKWRMRMAKIYLTKMKRVLTFKEIDSTLKGFLNVIYIQHYYMVQTLDSEQTIRK